MKQSLFIAFCLASGLIAKSQLVLQSGATLFIESGAKVTIQGDLTSSANILGTGTIVMKGSSAQNINMNGGTIPNLEIDNTSNVTLSGGNTRVGLNLLFTNGKLVTGSQDLVLGSSTTVTGYNTNKFIWTNGNGQVRKELTADISNYEIPVGENANYRPVYISSTGGSYVNASIGVRSISGSSANKPPMMANYIATYWPVTKTGITGGTQTLTGRYLDPTDVSGTETNLSGYFFNGTDWTSGSELHDYASNTVTAPISSASGELTAMNKFITIGSRAFLQGAYNSSTGLMNDGLRAGGNVIPVTDPYRTAPYNTMFTHVANPNAEIASASVFNDQPISGDNIVDWVFLQLRNTTASPGNAVIQTRSAFVQRDGDIVDIDGVSPVTFNNVTNGSYVLSVRHRNHLGISSDNMTAGNWRTFSETKSIAFSSNLLDFRTEATSKIFGTSYGSDTHPVLGTVRLLYGGDASGNGIVRYTNPGNDKDAILSSIGGVTTGSLSNVYRQEDVYMNRQIRYTNPNNDKDFLLTVIGGTTTGSRTQVLPN